MKNALQMTFFPYPDQRAFRTSFRFSSNSSAAFFELPGPHLTNSHTHTHARWIIVDTLTRAQIMSGHVSIDSAATQQCVCVRACVRARACVCVCGQSDNWLHGHVTRRPAPTDGAGANCGHTHTHMPRSCVGMYPLTMPQSTSVCMYGQVVTGYTGMWQGGLHPRVRGILAFPQA